MNRRPGAEIVLAKIIDAMKPSPTPPDRHLFYGDLWLDDKNELKMFDGKDWTPIGKVFR